jgi:hypothetical protein
MLRGLGYVVTIAFEKRCRNYNFTAAGRQMLATLVRVPEIDGHFLEVETITNEDQVHAALDDVRAVLAELGLADEDLTTELRSTRTPWRPSGREAAHGPFWASDERFRTGEDPPCVRSCRRAHRVHDAV